MHRDSNVSSVFSAATQDSFFRKSVQVKYFRYKKAGEKFRYFPCMMRIMMRTSEDCQKFVKISISLLLK